MKKFKNFIFILTVFFCSTSVNCSEKIVYIDMDKIMQISKAGKNAISKIRSKISIDFD